MMDRFFRLQEHATTVSKEILCGVTAFLTMSYILFVNPAIVSGSGMPPQGVFVATVLAAATSSIIMGLISNAPFGMAPGMGLNTFFTFVVCAGLGFQWQEALALVFVSGLAHMLIMATGMRKALVNAIPQHLKMSFGVGLGLFIGYTGLKSGGFLMFTTPPGQSAILEGGTVISTSAAVPRLVGVIAGPQVIALIGITVMLVLLAFEKKTGDSYAALPIGILAATFVGIPLNITNLIRLDFINFSADLEHKKVLIAYLGEPGFLSIAADPVKLLMGGLAVMILLVTNVMDSVGTIVGIGQVQSAEIFSEQDMASFSRTGETTRLDRALLCNSFGGCTSSALGTTTTTTYMEPITGIVAGGRTGLVAVTVGCMFLICLPLANFFSMIPAAAIAPALIIAGAYMMPLVSRINWHNFEECFPAFATAMCIPLTYSFAHGIATGVLVHIVIQLALGKGRSVHPMLYAITLVFIVVLGAESWL